MELAAYHALCGRFFPEHFLPQPAPLQYPDCPEMEGTSLAALLGSFRPGSPLLGAYNRMLGPDRLGIEDGHVIFCEEAQAINYWGIPTAGLDSENPAVWRAENLEPLVWEQETATLAGFLTTFVLWQALNGAWPYTAYSSRVPKRALASLLRPTEPIAVPGADVGIAFHARGDALLLATAGPELFVAARDRTAWDELQAAAPIGWSRASTDDGA